MKMVLADLEIGPELKGVPRGLSQLRSDSQLDPKATLPSTVASLVRRGAVLRGMFVPCASCGTSEWYDLAELDERLSCRGCGATQPLDLLDSAGDELRWQFRLNSLFNRAVDQDTLPNILTLFRLRSRSGGTCCSIGLELLGPDGQPRHELDVVYVRQGRVVGAECKAGSRLLAKDVEAARLASRSGFSEFWFTTTAESWNPEAEALVETLKEEVSAAGMYVGLLTAAHLFGEQSLPVSTSVSAAETFRLRSRGLP